MHLSGTFLTWYTEHQYWHPTAMQTSFKYTCILQENRHLQVYRHPAGVQPSHIADTKWTWWYIYIYIYIYMYLHFPRFLLAPYGTQGSVQAVPPLQVLCWALLDSRTSCFTCIMRWGWSLSWFLCCDLAVTSFHVETCGALKDALWSEIGVPLKHVDVIA